ncbi:dTMP kinase [Acidihalobacter prosperus]
MRGLFITLEGGEGVGKSTQLIYIRELLESLAHSVVTTREPGGTPMAESIRRLLKNKSAEEMDPDTELLLVFAARNEHLEKIIRPALARGAWVVCDRFTDATYAYQGRGRGISHERIEILEKWVHEDLQPDVTLLLDAPPRIGFIRVNERGEEFDRFESESTEFFERIRQGYLSRAELFPQRFHVIDASRTRNEVSADIHDILIDCHQTWANSANRNAAT